MTSKYESFNTKDVDRTLKIIDQDITPILVADADTKEELAFWQNEFEIKGLKTAFREGVAQGKKTIGLWRSIDEEEREEILRGEYVILQGRLTPHYGEERKKPKGL